jgi:hypothetical protein
MPSSDHVSQRYLAGRGALRSRCTQLLRLTGFELGIGDDALVTERGKLGQLVSYGTRESSAAARVRGLWPIRGPA